METGYIPLEERSSNHIWEDLYLRHCSAWPAMAMLFRIWCSGQFVYTASFRLSFSKRIYFYPPNILQFTYPKEPCFFGSFPLAALVGNLSEHLSLLLISVWLTASKRWPLSGNKQRDFLGITKSLLENKAFFQPLIIFLWVLSKEIAHRNLPSCICPLRAPKHFLSII